jgi:hypothetical protein
LEETSLSEFYFEELNKSTNSVQVLVRFYKALFELEEVNKNIYQSFSRLVRIYGAKNVYFSLLDCSGMENLDLSDNLVRLISYFCKKRLEDRDTSIPINNLDKRVNEVMKEFDKKKRIKIPEPFEEEDWENVGHPI